MTLKSPRGRVQSAQRDVFHPAEIIQPSVTAKYTWVGLRANPPFIRHWKMTCFLRSPVIWWAVKYDEDYVVPPHNSIILQRPGMVNFFRSLDYVPPRNRLPGVSTRVLLRTTATVTIPHESLLIIPNCCFGAMAAKKESCNV